MAYGNSDSGEVIPAYRCALQELWVRRKGKKERGLR